MVLNAWLVVSTSLNATSAELLAQSVFLALRLLAPPLFDNTEHEPTPVACPILTIVSQSRVGEDAVDDAVECTFNVNTLIVPASHDLWNDPLDGLSSNLPCWLVENVREVILGEHGMGGIRGVVIIKDDVLLGHTGLDDLIRAGVELGLDLVDDWDH